MFILPLIFMDLNAYICAKCSLCSNFCCRRAQFRFDLKMHVNSLSTFNNVPHIAFTWGSNAHSACFEGVRCFTLLIIFFHMTLLTPFDIETPKMHQKRLRIPHIRLCWPKWWAESPRFGAVEGIPRPQGETINFQARPICTLEPGTARLGHRGGGM